jgi:hypothetical protein
MANASAPIDPNRTLRWLVYALLIALSVGNAAGRILAVNSVDKLALDKQRIAEGKRTSIQRPFLSANDRSRWLAIRALVEEGRWEIDNITAQPNWDTIDMVQHRGRDGELHLYSSKPPLMELVYAAPYWLVHKATGATLGTHPYEIGRGLLVLFNLLPWALLLVLIAALAERLSTSDGAKLFTVAAASFGTLLSPFLVVLNNHLHAAVCVALAVYALVRIKEQPAAKWFVLAGIATSLAAVNELPALAIVAATGLLLIHYHPRLTLTAFALPVAIVAAAFFAANYSAHNSLRPPYAHRSKTDPADNWYEFEYTVNGVQRDSYWKNPQGIDQGEPSKARYAFHCLIGGHGLFSLTPIWLLSAYGGWCWVRSGNYSQRELALLGLGLMAVCLVFYIGLRPQVDRNYGGWTSGLRWLFWLIPLWLLMLLPAWERMEHSRFGRAIALVLLAMSCLSAAYPTWNPWTHPWIYNWLN